MPMKNCIQVVICKFKLSIKLKGITFGINTLKMYIIKNNI